MISMEGIKAAGQAAAVANGVMAFSLLVGTLVSLLAIGWVISRMDDKEREERSVAIMVAGVLLAVYMVVLLPGIMWFVWHGLVAMMAPEFYVLQRLP